MKGMLVTVGTGQGVHEGIKEAIVDANPDALAFVVSSESKATLKMAADTLAEGGHERLAELCKSPAALVEVQDPESLDSCYKAADDAIRLLAQRDVQPSSIVVDYTSGTKAMSAGAVLAAFGRGCEKFSYVGGTKRDSAGRVLRGAESVRTLRPCTIARDAAVQDLVAAFNRFQFDAGRAIIESLRSRMSAELLHDVNKLASAFEFYDAWDRFDHASAAKLSAEMKEFDKAWKVDTEPNRDVVNRIASARQKADKGASNQQVRFVEFLKLAGTPLMADLLENAERRRRENRCDDAVARLYRLAELAAQVVLARKYGIAASAVPRSFLEERNLLDKYAPAGSEPIRLGLADAYKLLNDLGEDIGGAYFNNTSRLRDRLTARNESILAHGLNAVGPEVYDSLLKEVRAVCEHACDAKAAFERTLASCRFPKIAAIPLG